MWLAAREIAKQNTQCNTPRRGGDGGGGGVRVGNAQCRSRGGTGVPAPSIALLSMRAHRHIDLCGWWVGGFVARARREGFGTWVQILGLEKQEVLFLEFLTSF